MEPNNNEKEEEEDYDEYISHAVFVRIGKSLQTSYSSPNSEDDLFKLNEKKEEKEKMEKEKMEKEKMEKGKEKEKMEKEKMEKEKMEKEKEKEKEKKKEKEKEENKLAIAELYKKINEYEEKQKFKKKGFLDNLFTTNKDILNETLEKERYFYNKMLLDKLINF
jgi:hypothetical protein